MLNKNMIYIFLAFITTRIFNVVVAVSAFSFIGNKLPLASPMWRGVIPSHNILVSVWQRWDACFYQKIATFGYGQFADGVYDTAFFPLYPFLAKVLNVFDNMPLSLLLISNISLFFALYFIFELVSDDYNVLVAKKTIWVLLSFPFAFFFTGIYAESLFLMLLTGSLYAMKKNNLILLAVFSLLLPLTKAIGFVILPVTIYFLVNKKISFFMKVLLVLLPIISLVGYYLYSGDVGQTFSMSSTMGWKRYLTFPWTSIIKQIERIINHDYSIIFIYNLIVSFSFISVFLLMIKRKMKMEYLIITFFLILIPLCSNQLKSFVRYSIVVFPIFIYLAEKLDEKYLLGLGFSLQGFFLALYVNWYYIA